MDQARRSMWVSRGQDGWEEHIKPHLLDTRTYERRVNFERYRETRSLHIRQQVFLTASIVAPFDTMNPMCGYENLLAAMALDPEWVRDMCEVYSGVTINLLEMLFEREGAPDGIWIWDHLGFKSGRSCRPRCTAICCFRRTSACATLPTAGSYP